MCGQAAALPSLLEGLRRLEYRGYDSAGVALSSAGSHPEIYRAMGPLAALEAVLPEGGSVGTTGIGHTRWATHGAPSTENAHPHRDCRGTIAVVHNGTIENAGELRAALTTTGHRIATEVDTEVIAHLIEHALRGRRDLASLVEAVGAAAARLTGSWALAVTAVGVEGIVVTRHHSPLLVAVTSTAVMASSDALGFSGEVETVRELADGDIVALGPQRSVTWFDAAARPTESRVPLQVSASQLRVELDGAADFTAKEIAEQPTTAENLLERIGAGLITDLALPVPARIRLVACGSSAYAAQVTARTLSMAAGIPARVVTASEYADDLDEPGTLTIAFSQSGETADVLAARRAWTGPWLTVTNSAHSSLARRSDAIIDLACGPEMGVAATKSFTAQVIAGAALALQFGRVRGLVSAPVLDAWQETLYGLPSRLAATDALSRPVAASLAADLAEHPAWVYISRGAGIPYAYEGALKLKELAYRWTEVLPAGELKHGPIALIQPGVPVIAINAEPLSKLAVNISELRARGAQIVSVGGRESTLPVVLPEQEPPWGPLEAVVALQHLARETTRHLGHNVDRPRNLAKSVTVE